MLPKPQNYTVYPSIVKAGTPTTITVAPTEKAFLLFEGEEYDVCVVAANCDLPAYVSPVDKTDLKLTARGGVLQFCHTFADEGEFFVLLKKNDIQLARLPLFCLADDLYALRPLKGDLHAHSFRSDGARDPAALAGHYREQGYEFFALTDHNRYYPGGEIDETYQGLSLGITHIRGEEVHTPPSIVHIVHVGGGESVTAFYHKHPEEYRSEVADYLANRVPAEIPEKYRERYAMAMWATDRIHKAGGLAIFPHPFWRPRGITYNVCDEFATLLLKSGMFDAYELIGGMGQVGINRSVAFWADLRAEGLRLPVVGSSDVHKLENSSYFAHTFTICFAKSNSPADILAAVKAGNAVAVELTGTEEKPEYRCYGSLRLVTYAQFLLQYYYPRLTRICQGEGVAMRAFAMGDADAALVECQVAQSERFRRRFFGLDEAPMPSAAVLDFEARWRETHLDGPETKGSTIVAPPVTRQI